ERWPGLPAAPPKPRPPSFACAARPAARWPLAARRWRASLPFSCAIMRDSSFFCAFGGPKVPPASQEARLLQQRPRTRLASPKLFEDLHRVTAAAQRQNGAPKLATRRENCARLVEPRVLERAERVGAQHLGPLVAVVAGCVATRENVREAAEETILGQRRND